MVVGGATGWKLVEGVERVATGGLDASENIGMFLVSDILFLSIWLCVMRPNIIKVGLFLLMIIT